MSKKKAKAEVVVGTPTMVLLPSNNYKFTVSKKEYKITIPREGLYNELDEEFFGDDGGGFKILDEESMTLYLPSITKVLFGAKKYPKLEANQLFAPVALVFGDKTVEIVGQLIEMLPIEG